MITPTKADHEMAASLAYRITAAAFADGDHHPDVIEMGLVIATALAAERRRALLDAAEHLDFTPLSERESGQVSDYTKGVHAAAKILRLLAGDVS